MSGFQGGGFQGGRGNGRGFAPRGGGAGRFNGGRQGGGRQSDRTFAGGGGGRGYGQNQNNNNEAAVYDVCKHSTTGSCTYGDNCRKAHVITLGFNVPAHKDGATTVNMMPDASGNPAPRVITGGNDGTIKIWNITNQPPVPETTFNATGKVRHLEVMGNTVLWSVDEPLVAEQNPLLVGTIYMMLGDGSSSAIRRSQHMPCTHPMGEIRDFKVESMGDAVYVISGGAEGMIHTWRFNTTSNAFEHVIAFDSHFRAVTSVVLHENMLWTGSVDQTIRIWNPATSQCERELTHRNNGPGHTAAVTCLLVLPPTPQQAAVHIASGGMDGTMRLWSTTGEFIHQVAHESEVMCMTTFYSDPQGIPLILLGLANGTIAARSRNTMSLIFRMDSAVTRTGGINAIYDLRQFNSFVVVTTDGALICWTVKPGLQEGSS